MPRFAPLLALAVLALAGCAEDSSPNGNGATPPASGAPGPRFEAPITLPGERGGPEPTIVMAPDDGTIFVAAQDPVGGGPRVWISRDGGTAWTEKRPTTEGGGEVSIAAGPGGFVVLTQLGQRGNVVSVSRDGGDSWTTAPLGSVTQYFDRQWAAIDERGSAYLLARVFSDRTSAAVSRSDDRGLTWLHRGNPWDADHEPGNANGNLLAAGGALWVPYVCRDAKAVCASVSRDRGVSWDQSLVVARDVGVDNVYPAIALLGATPVVTWSDASSGRLAVWSAVSTDGGASWSAPVRVSREDESATLPWVAADARSRAWIVYLSAQEDLRAADGKEAAQASWRVVAVPILDNGAPRTAGGPAWGESVHTGVLSRPVGRPSADAPFDRNFGDFFTAALTRAGKLVVAVSSDRGSPESIRASVIREG